ncbi:hypothetical protein QTP70_007333 [Hemibagrus guttatus]|uniref:ribonuclease H n=1 Tax=Hemibagrus guttatus TaxID=175788 RepID=A0AAE0Q0B6_9TELE|nr:hypothetical protein QTP70_007333 [Hemibagrus guttatus]
MHKELKIQLCQRSEPADVGEPPATLPTVGTNLTDLTLRKRRVTVRELGGCMGPIWPSYFRDCTSVIFMVDSANITQISSSCIQLLCVLSAEPLRSASVLVLFNKRKSTTDAIFALRILMEKYRDGQRELHCLSVDLEKAYDRVPRAELWYCMRTSGVAEKYVRVVQDMYERSRTVGRCAVGQTEEFKVEVGLHQGSALSPFLFAMVMDQLSEKVRQESPWTMMFADDIVVCSESREQVEENLERWRFALERRGMKVSRSKTEYMCVNEREGSGTVRLQGEEVKKVQEFKYLGSTVQSNGECGKEVKKRVQAGWNEWRKVSGVLCDQKISARIKGKVYRTVVRPAMLYGLETVSLRKRQESELEVAELEMLRFSLGVTRLDRIRNEYIRGTGHVGCLGDKVREARLRWFGHVQRRESEYTGRRMLDMELPGRRQRGRPKRRYMDGINDDMKLVGASVEDAEDRERWREMIRCGDP